MSGADCDTRALVRIRVGGVTVGVRDSVTGVEYWDRCSECAEWLDAEALAVGHDCQI